jgi:hypothetical protein
LVPVDPRPFLQSGCWARFGNRDNIAENAKVAQTGLHPFRLIIRAIAQTMIDNHRVMMLASCIDITLRQQSQRGTIGPTR